MRVLSWSGIQTSIASARGQSIRRPQQDVAPELAVPLLEGSAAASSREVATFRGAPELVGSELAGPGELAHEEMS